MEIFHNSGADRCARLKPLPFLNVVGGGENQMSRDTMLVSILVFFKTSFM